jgi:hypothetical protein
MRNLGDRARNESGCDRSCPEAVLRSDLHDVPPQNVDDALPQEKAESAGGFGEGDPRDAIRSSMVA